MSSTIELETPSEQKRADEMNIVFKKPKAILERMNLSNIKSKFTSDKPPICLQYKSKFQNRLYLNHVIHTMDSSPKNLWIFWRSQTNSGAKKSI